MIRLRDKNGKAYKTPAGITALEVCDVDGKPALVFVLNPDGSIDMHSSGEPAFNRYCKRYGLDKAEVVGITDEDVWKGGERRGPVVVTKN